MINSTTEDASSNKRSKSENAPANGTTAAFGGAAAAASTDLASTLGPRLKPIKDLLAMQPTELKGTILNQSTEMLDLCTEMLDLRTTIRQQMKSRACFKKPSTDATTGATQNNKAGNPLPFIPNSL